MVLIVVKLMVLDCRHMEQWKRVDRDEMVLLLELNEVGEFEEEEMKRDKWEVSTAH